MAKNKNTSPRNTEKDRDYYKLNTKAVDRLVNADKIDTSKVNKLKEKLRIFTDQNLHLLTNPILYVMILMDKLNKKGWTLP